MYELRQNRALGEFHHLTTISRKPPLTHRVGDEVANTILNKYGSIDYEWGISSASTDFVSPPK